MFSWKHKSEQTAAFHSGTRVWHNNVPQTTTFLKQQRSSNNNVPQTTTFLKQQRSSNNNVPQTTTFLKQQRSSNNNVPLTTTFLKQQRSSNNNVPLTTLLWCSVYCTINSYLLWSDITEPALLWSLGVDPASTVLMMFSSSSWNHRQNYLWDGKCINQQL